MRYGFRAKKQGVVKRSGWQFALWGVVEEGLLCCTRLGVASPAPSRWHSTWLFDGVSTGRESWLYNDKWTDARMWEWAVGQRGAKGSGV